MALLRQYSLLNLPPTWKASLISSYGSFLAQDFSSPFQRSLIARNSSSTTIPLPPPAPQTQTPPIPSNLGPNSAVAAQTSRTTSTVVPPQNPPPPPPNNNARKNTTSSPSRSSPNNNKQRTYPCNECGKIFNAHYNLTRHMPVHTGIDFLIFL